MYSIQSNRSSWVGMGSNCLNTTMRALEIVFDRSLWQLLTAVEPPVQAQLSLRAKNHAFGSGSTEKSLTRQNYGWFVMSFLNPSRPYNEPEELTFPGWHCLHRNIWPALATPSHSSRTIRSSKTIRFFQCFSMVCKCWSGRHMPNADGEFIFDVCRNYL